MINNKNLFCEKFNKYLFFTKIPKTQKNAFSLAEAMITLTIFAVLAASAAPLVSKQMKYNDLNDMQSKVMMKHSVSKGTIVMWSGSINNIPDGWALCNGGSKNGVTIPDLRGKFIVGYDQALADYNSIGKNGGENKITLSESNIPRHSHTKGTMRIQGKIKGVDDNNNDILSFIDNIAEDLFYTKKNTLGRQGSTPIGGGVLAYNGPAVSTIGFDTDRQTTRDDGSKTDSWTGETSFYGGKLIDETAKTYKTEEFENRPSYYVLAYIIKII